MNASAKPLLSVRDLKTWFDTGRTGLFGRGSRPLKAIDGISFEIDSGEVLGLVGESGCGKSTVGRTLTLLERATGGKALFEGRDILKMSSAEFRPLRRSIQMIFQDPFASLNPRLTIGQTLTEPTRIHGVATGKQEIKSTIAVMLNQVGLDQSAMTRYPHEFSGGQRQRVAIARVMILAPKLIIADEAVSALDVSIQAQVLNLIKDLQHENGVSMLFISHDLGVVRHISDRIAVMYLGRIVEMGRKDDMFTKPAHPYTKLLLSSIPSITPGRRKVRDLGEPASAASPPPGCAFHPRCPIATDICRSTAPEQYSIGDDHVAACHHTDKAAEVAT